MFGIAVTFRIIAWAGLPLMDDLALEAHVIHSPAGVTALLRDRYRTTCGRTGSMVGEANHDPKAASTTNLVFGKDLRRLIVSHVAGPRSSKIMPTRRTPGAKDKMTRTSRTRLAAANVQLIIPLSMSLAKLNKPPNTMNGNAVATPRVYLCAPHPR